MIVCRHLLVALTVGATLFAPTVSGLAAGKPAVRAVDAVRDILRKSGVKVGLDRVNMCSVAIGSCARDMENPAQDPEFLQKRNECALLAELDARRNLVKMRRQTMRLKDAAQLVGVDDVADISVASYYESLCGGELGGVMVLCSAESWNPKTRRYQVTVAVGQSAKSVAAAKALSLDEVKIVEGGEEDPEWAAWARTANLAGMVGSRGFVDSEGRLRFVGIGFVDIEELSGRALYLAYRQAKIRAARNLAYLMRADLASKEVLKTLVQAVAAGTMTNAAAWEEYTSRLVQKTSDYQMVHGHQVYETDVCHPITGRKMHVSVYGLSTKKE